MELLEREPSTATLVELIRGMVQHFLQILDGPDQEEAQRLRLMATSHPDDGEFARSLYAKIETLIGAVFVASLERRGRRRRCAAKQQRAAQPVLVCASYGDDRHADQAAGRAPSCLWQAERIWSGSSVSFS